MDGYYETYCRFCGARLDPETGFCAEYECFRCGRRPDELVLTRHVNDEIRFLEIDCAPLEPAVVTTSADVYGPEDPVEILVAAPGAWRREATVEVRRQGLVLDRIDVDLSPQGNALVSLPPFEVGKYLVHLTANQPRGRTLVQDHSFQVAYRDLSVLRAVVLESSRQNEMLVFRLLVTWMAGEPYEGPIDLIILDDQDEIEIFRMGLDVRRGRVSGAFRTPEWVGPFSARLSTPQGQTTWIRFLDDLVGFADEILGQSFGQRRRLSLSAWQGLEECHGIRFLAESRSTAPVVPADMIGRRGELVAQRDVPRLYVQVRHPGSGGRVENALYTGVKAGERVPFSATPPYCYYLVAADFNERGAAFEARRVFEGWGVFFVWNEGRAVVRSPRRVEPGAALRIEVDGTRGTEGFLVVRQVGIPSTPVTEKLAAALYENVRSNCLLEGPETYAEEETFADGEEDFVFEEDDSDPSAGLPDHLRQVPGLDRLIDDLVAGTPQGAPAERPAVRQEDLRILLLRRIMLDGPVEFAVRTPERIGDVETIFYQCGPHGWRVDRSVTEVGGEEYVYGATPEFLFPDDSVEVELRYRSEHPARLVAIDETGAVVAGSDVEGEGTVPVVLDRPGVLEWSLEGMGSAHSVRRRIDAGGRRRVVRTRFRYLEPGEAVEGPRLVAYPDVRMFRDDLADALSRYPHGCSEQISCRLRALVCLWPASDAHRTLLGLKIRRLARSLAEYEATMSQGLWALWPGEAPDLRVSAQVLKNLRPYLEVPDFPEVAELARRAAEVLLASGVTDNELLPVDVRFREEGIPTPEAATAAVLHGPPDAREAGLSFLAETASLDPEGRRVWRGRSWAGRWETTAKVARALLAAGHPWADEALATLSDRLVDGRFHSTTDSVAFLELLEELALAPRPSFEVDGRPVPTDEIAVGTRIRCLEGRLLVRWDGEEVLERPQAPIHPEATIDVAPSGDWLRVGKRIRLLVDFGSPDPEAVCRLYLPPTLALCRTGSKEQELQVPLRVRRLAIDCLCVRRGEGSARGLVENLYREDERFWVEGPRIRVG